MPGDVSELPDGAVIAAAGEAYTTARGRAFRWSAQGSQGHGKSLGSMACPTPPSTLLAIRAGYRPVLHPTIETW
jgi:hypothetical protein